MKEGVQMTDEQFKELIQALTSIAISIDELATEVQEQREVIEGLGETIANM